MNKNYNCMRSINNYQNKNHYMNANRMKLKKEFNKYPKRKI